MLPRLSMHDLEELSEQVTRATNACSRKNS
jgi:hypothetical protein